MRLNQCHNFQDFRLLAKKRLPSPIFNYIDGAADDEITYRRNTQSFNDIDLALARVSTFCVVVVTVKGPKGDEVAVLFGKSFINKVIFELPCNTLKSGMNLLTDMKN